MNKKRAEYLKQFCHDRAIELRTAKECGKIIPSIGDVANLYDMLEEVLNDKCQEKLG